MSQADKILAHLKTGAHITPLEAIGLFGAFRLAARINELRTKGHDIVTDVRSDGNGRTYARYLLAA
jgi:hypothetical protein